MLAAHSSARDWLPKVPLTWVWSLCVCTAVGRRMSWISAFRHCEVWDLKKLKADASNEALVFRLRFVLAAIALVLGFCGPGESQRRLESGGRTRPNQTETRRNTAETVPSGFQSTLTVSRLPQCG